MRNGYNANDARVCVTDLASARHHTNTDAITNANSNAIASANELADAQDWAQR